MLANSVPELNKIIQGNHSSSTRHSNLDIEHSRKCSRVGVMMLVLAKSKRQANNDRVTAIMATVVSVRATPLNPSRFRISVMVPMMIFLLVVRIKRCRLSEVWIAAALPF